MNNLKFRAWDKTAKKMSKVTAIDFSTKPFRVFYKAYGNENYFNQDAILMQSTGLFDKNGVEVFEGDILKVLGFTDWIGEVRYSQEELSYFFVEHENSLRLKYTTLLSLLDKKLEVIGNIYENKELLENE